MSGLMSLPLEKLPLISLDLETTGLKTKTDRIVQIGVYDPQQQKEQIDQLIQPGVAIPEKSTAIHGIDQSMVADSPVFSHVFPQLRDCLNDRVIIGYNIGFDLAVLETEANRHGLEWEIPPAICVRQMAILALGRDTMLMMGTLEALAIHFGVSSDHRHTAMGDARMTAGLFFALLPLLQKQNITSFADLLKAVTELDDQRNSTVLAGWVDVAAIRQASSSFRALSRIDPFPYSHRINEIMISNPLIMPPAATALEAAAMMKAQKRECVFVGTAPDQIVGIVSERDIVHCMALPLKEVSRARAMRLDTIMSSPVITVTQQDYMHVALGRMQKHDIRHLGVVDAGDILTGYISGRELNRLRLTEAMVIGDEIAHAQDADHIGHAIKGLPHLCKSLLDEGIKAYAIASVVSGQYRAAVARAAELAEAMMATDQGPPPCDYCVLILGSGGRDESLLAADQDHAIIYADAPKAEQAKTQRWFETLGQHVADILDQAGIPYCDGGVMANTAKWCKSLSDWQNTIRHWINRTKAEDILYVDIFFDFHAVYGNQRLAYQLQNDINSALKGQSDFLKMLAGNMRSHNAGSTFWGGFSMENGRFNLKRNMLLPMIETLRILATSRMITARNSVERAEQLVKTGTAPPELIPLSEDLQFCVRLVLRQQIADIDQGQPPSTLIELAKLSAREKRTLKSAQARVKQLDQLLFDCLFG